MGNLQEKKYLRRAMMRLWKETFGDSDDYVGLIFRYLYLPENIMLKTDHHGNTVCGILGVPYLFMLNNCCDRFEKLHGAIDCDDNENIESVFKGMYLCGLATKPKFRGQGFMSNMLHKMEQSLKKRGYDFCFLIPADDHLRKYYERSGYRTISHREVCDFGYNLPLFENLERHRDAFVLNGLRYEIVFKNEDEIFRCVDNGSCLTFENLTFSASELDNILRVQCNETTGDSESISHERLNLLAECYELFRRNMLKHEGVSIIHTPIQFLAALAENHISGGEIIVAKDSNKKVRGFMALRSSENGRGEVRVISAEHVETELLLLLALMGSVPGLSSVEVSCLDQESLESLGKMAGGCRAIGKDGKMGDFLMTVISGVRTVPYAMAKWLLNPCEKKKRNSPSCDEIIWSEICKIPYGWSGITSQFDSQRVDELLRSVKMSDLWRKYWNYVGVKCDFVSFRKEICNEVEFANVGEFCSENSQKEILGRFYDSDNKDGSEVCENTDSDPKLNVAFLLD